MIRLYNALSNSSHFPNGAALTAYLVRMGPMPPVQNRDIAVAMLNRGLNGGQFEAQNHYAYVPQLPRPEAQQEHNSEEPEPEQQPPGKLNFMVDVRQARINNFF